MENNQKELEQIFEEVDQLKRDLTNHEITINTEEEWLINEEENTWYKKGIFLFRNDKQMLICSDWMVHGFPDVKSILYRIGVGGHQIRGYIFTNREVRTV